MKSRPRFQRRNRPGVINAGDAHAPCAVEADMQPPLAQMARPRVALNVRPLLDGERGASPCDPHKVATPA